ncbi:MAG: hypothetical protein O3B68_18405 [Planctomycetota bacterium]|nr:hypothetical protein [Planctomycetota bacterium]
MTENLEPRLVLSPLSLRGSVDPPRSTPPDSTPQDETPLQVFTRDSQQSQVSQRQFVLSDVYVVPVAEVPVLTPVDPPDTGTTPTDSVSDVADEPGVIVVTNDRTSSDGGTVDDDLADDSLSTDDRTSVLVDSVADADGTRADAESDAEETVDVIVADRTDSSSESPSVSSADSATKLTVDSPVKVRSASGIRGVFAHAQKTVLPAVSHAASTVSESSVGNESASWIASLTESVKSWLNFEGLESGTAVTMADSSVPYVALAGGFSLVAVGRKGLAEADAFEAEETAVGVWKPDRRSGRVTDRRRFRWFGFATKDRRNRPSGEISKEQPALKQNLSEPDISEAFAMSLMQSVGEDAFKLSPMPSGDEGADESSEDSSLSIELVAAGAATVAGGTMARRSRSSAKKTLLRPTIDYSGTTLPRS